MARLEIAEKQNKVLRREQRMKYEISMQKKLANMRKEETMKNLQLEEQSKLMQSKNNLFPSLVPPNYQQDYERIQETPQTNLEDQKFQVNEPRIMSKMMNEMQQDLNKKKEDQNNLENIDKNSLLTGLPLHNSDDSDFSKFFIYNSPK